MSRERQLGALDRMTVAVDETLRPAITAAKRPKTARKLRRAAQLFGAAMLILFAFGAVMMATMLPPLYVVVGVFALAAWPLLFARLARRFRALHVAGITPVAILVPIVTLLGFDVVWASVGLPRPKPAIGLVIAGLVVALVAYSYLRWVGETAPPHHRLWALVAGVGGLGLAAVTGQHWPQFGLLCTALAVTMATWLYLRRAAGPKIKHPMWWSLAMVGGTIVAAPLIVEAIEGHRVNLALLIAGALIAVVAAISRLAVPVQTNRLQHARHAFSVALFFCVALPLLVLAFVKLTSNGPTVAATRVPRAVGLQQLPQAAYDHRPILLFDSGERFHTPIDVDRMLASGDVQLCPEDQGLLADCQTINGANELRNHVGNLRFDTQQIADDDLPTTIYAHAVADQLHPGWTDIDYWWYLPDNPANTAQGAMCGAGLVIPEITCFDHQSDWEGATVVVDQSQQPMAVHYAAHNHVIDVPWTTLQAAVNGKLLQPYAASRDVADRPLVFVARGTHAAYPLPCQSSTCNGDSLFEDNSHNGQNAWPATSCAGMDCVTAFPQGAKASSNASWNAFDGHWGSAVCLADIYCARSAAPKAPGQQGRFKHPWCYDFEAAANLAHPRAVKPKPCRL